LTAYLSVQEAQKRIVAAFDTVSTETLPLLQCAGRVLAVEVISPADLPPFDNSSMDGFAVRSADVANASPNAPVTLRITADIAAGADVSIPISPGEAARIMTGAPVPPGADTVVPVEDTSFSPETSGSVPNLPVASRVLVFQGAPAGSNIRPRGNDIRAKQPLLRAGRRLQPQDIGLLAAIGQAMVEVYRKPRVAIFSSGDELVQPGSPLNPGQIYDSNQYVLSAMLEREGALVFHTGTAPDNPNVIEEMLRGAVAQGVDLILTSAGVSVGAFDYVRQVIEKHGSLDFWKVNMRPGKPLAFGSFLGTPVIALPGNPVSAFVGCLVFVLPAIYRMAGHAQAALRRTKAILLEDVTSDGRESYLRAVAEEKNGRLAVRLTGHQGSGNLYSLVQANALLIVPSGVKSLPSDSEVELWFFNTDATI
jgi:molybdopterin molybdotransferase